MYLCIFVSTYLSVYLSIHLSIHLHISVYLSVCIAGNIFCLQKTKHLRVIELFCAGGCLDCSVNFLLRNRSSWEFLEVSSWEMIHKPTKPHWKPMKTHWNLLKPIIFMAFQQAVVNDTMTHWSVFFCFRVWKTRFLGCQTCIFHPNEHGGYYHPMIFLHMIGIRTKPFPSQSW